MVARAGVPTIAFPEVLATGEEERLRDAFEEALARLSEAVLQAAGREERWLRRVRAGLVALLGFLDDEPAWARLLVVQAPAAGVAGPERARRVLGALVELLNEGRAETGAASVLSPALTAELVVGGAFSVIQARMLDPDGGALVELAPSLTAFVVTPYLGHAAASAELAGTAAAGAARARVVELPIRATERTTQVLGAIAAAPLSSNREIARDAGLADEGQTSRLLGRLERRGLIENIGLGQVRGEPNAWLLTPYGRRVTELNGRRLAPDVPAAKTSAKVGETA
ncbi:MAG TPA: helix-turn-helix domain-containing protein [Solirubrobacteraceae bacterium]|nr:helix-turn-helix domain-containing protein [Solirubrobacteraceae bacterium]